LDNDKDRKLACPFLSFSLSDNITEKIQKRGLLMKSAVKKFNDQPFYPGKSFSKRSQS